MKAKHSLCEEIAKSSGVSVDNVEKVLTALGIDHHIEEATKALGAAPKLNDVLIGFHTSKNSIMV